MRKRLADAVDFLLSRLSRFPAIRQKVPAKSFFGGGGELCRDLSRMRNAREAEFTKRTH